MNEVMVRLSDERLFDAIKKEYARPETFEEFQNIIRRQEDAAINCNDKTLFTLTMDELIQILDQYQQDKMMLNNTLLHMREVSKSDMPCETVQHVLTTMYHTISPYIDYWDSKEFHHTGYKKYLITDGTTGIEYDVEDSTGELTVQSVYKYIQE